MSIVGGALDFVSNLMTNAFNAANVSKTNSANKQIAAQSNETNMALNQANIEMQERQNEINRMREDDAVRRRVNDLVGAGLSKTLAAGSAASANAMAAPQNTFGAQVGNPMVAHKGTAYKGFETAAYHRKQAEIADKELDLKGTELDIAQQEADERKRHNEADEANAAAANEENVRYHDMMDEWKKAELDQESKFHDDAVKIEWANTQIKYLSYMSEAANKEFQNLWYSTQAELARNADERDAKRLTADLAEASAKIASYFSGIKVDQAQIKYIQEQTKSMAASVVEKIANARNLDAKTKETMVDSLTKMYNLVLANKEGTTTTGHIVSESEAQQNALDRGTGIAKTGLTTVAAIIAVVVKCFI